MVGTLTTTGRTTAYGPGVKQRTVNSADRLRVVVANPLAEDLCRLIEHLEPRIDLVRDQTLYPPMRHPADFGGDPSFTRTAEQQQQFDETVDSAEALYGIPD